MNAEVPTPEQRAAIRVLWLIKGLGRGGSESLLANAAKVADHDTFSYEAAYVLPQKDALVQELASSGVRVHLLPMKHEFDLRWALQLRKLIREHRFDVLHNHSAYTAVIARLVIRSLRRRSRPKVITTEHVTWDGYPRLTRMLNTATFDWDDATIAVSDAVIGSIPSRKRNGVHCLNHGIPVAWVREQRAHRDQVRRELGVGPNEVLVGTIAQFREQKGYRYLLTAARTLMDRGIAVRFAAVGGAGADEHQIRALHERLGLGDRFLLLGVRSDAIRLLGACDVFALASLWEGLPLAVMEAMALGIPVVATKVGGIPELVSHGRTGILVPPADERALADAMQEMLADPERRSMMGRAAAEAAEAFDNARSVRFIEETYRQLASDTELHDGALERVGP